MSVESIQIGHLEVESPWGNAGGVAKQVEDVHKLGLTGAGWIEGGSWTLEPRPGNGPNGELVYVYDAETGLMLNALGMPNKGIDWLVRELPGMNRETRDKPLIANVAPVSTDPVTETQELVHRVYDAGATAVLLNAGCPNVPGKDGGRHEILSGNAEALRLVLAGLQRVTEKYLPIFIRVTPLERPQDAYRIAQVIAQSGVVSAVFTPNTWPLTPEDNSPLEVPPGVGGKSGPITADSAIYQAAQMRRFLSQQGGKKIDVVVSGGITTGKQLQQSMAMSGAVAGAGTTFYYQAEEGWSTGTNRLLHNFAEVAELT